jgi:hypothetical protein
MIWYAIAGAIEGMARQGVPVRRTRRYRHSIKRPTESSSHIRVLSAALLLLMAACILSKVAHHHAPLLSLRMPSGATLCATERFLTGRPLWERAYPSVCDI